jgi:hypothetical protein
MKEYMVEIGNDFVLPSHIDLSILDNIPTRVHNYGDPQPPKDEFSWMIYNIPAEEYEPGLIGFARNSYKGLPEVADYTVKYLSRYFDYKFSVEYVNFIKTSGIVPFHIDEGTRKSCINIGIMGSENAITSFLCDDGSTKDYIVKHSSAYLVDVSTSHGVKTIIDKPRLLITYGIGLDFEDMYSRLRS